MPRYASLARLAFKLVVGTLDKTLVGLGPLVVVAAEYGAHVVASYAPADGKHSYRHVSVDVSVVAA